MSDDLHASFVCDRCGDSTRHRCRLRGCPSGTAAPVIPVGSEDPRLRRIVQLERELERLYHSQGTGHERRAPCDPPCDSCTVCSHAPLRPGAGQAGVICQAAERVISATALRAWLEDRRNFNAVGPNPSGIEIDQADGYDAALNDIEEWVDEQTGEGNQ